MNQEDCKLLTEKMGLCWHDVEIRGDYDSDIYYYCAKCKEHSYVEFDNHTFDTDADMLMCFRWMVKENKWHKFYGLVLWDCACFSQEDGANFSEWLFDKPDRFCNLFLDAVKEGIFDKEGDYEKRKRFLD